MMDTQLYLRVRGRVLGPYDQEKLQSLVRRGQLSRMHEVSTDGANWVRASTYAELFVGAPVKLAAPECPPQVRRPRSSRQAIFQYRLPGKARRSGRQLPNRMSRQHQPAVGITRASAPSTDRSTRPICGRCWPWANSTPRHSSGTAACPSGSRHRKFPA